MKHFVLILASLLLTACGGGYTIDPARPTTGTIVVIGDSIAAGNGVPTAQRYSDRLQLQLEGTDYQILNQGVSGDRTDQGLARIDQVLAETPEIVILQLGGNDFLQGKNIAQVESNLRAMIEAIQAAKADVFLVGVIAPPTRGFGYIGQAREMYERLADAYDLVLYPNILKGLLLDGSYMQADKIHPTSSGHRLIAENLWEELAVMLRD